MDKHRSLALSPRLRTPKGFQHLTTASRQRLRSTSSGGWTVARHHPPRIRRHRRCTDRSPQSADPSMKDRWSKGCAGRTESTGEASCAVNVRHASVVFEEYAPRRRKLKVRFDDLGRELFKRAETAVGVQVYCRTHVPKTLKSSLFLSTYVPLVPLFLCTPREMGVNAIFFQTVDTISKSPYLFN